MDVLRNGLLLWAALFGLTTALAGAETYDPVQLSAAQILERAHAAYGSRDSGAYTEVERVTAGGVVRTETTYVNGDDYVTTTQGGGFTTSYGSYHGQNWNSNENGVVTLESNFRHKVDPNVLAWSHPEDPKYNVHVLGATQTAPVEYVIDANPPGGSDQYRYYDKQTLLLSRVVTYEKDRYRHVTDYGDYRRTFGSMEAFRVHSFDGRPQNDDEDDILTFDKTPAPVPLAIPPSRPIFALDGGSPVTLPVRFTPSGIVVRASINGRGLDFLLDSGAASLFIDPGVAHQLGLTPYGRSNETVGGGDVDMGTVRVPQMSLGPLQMNGVVFTTSPYDQDADGSRVVGLLGFDLLASAITEIDFKKQTVTVYPRAAFDPKALGLRPVAVQLDDGIPRVDAEIEHVPGSFLVDTGAFSMLAYQNYVDKLPSAPLTSSDFRIDTVGGVMNAQVRAVTDIAFGGVDFQHGNVVVPAASTFDITDYDGIIGRDALSAYQLYFDYPDRVLYVKLNM